MCGWIADARSWGPRFALVSVRASRSNFFVTAEAVTYKERDRQSVEIFPQRLKPRCCCGVAARLKPCPDVRVADKKAR